MRFKWLSSEGLLDVMLFSRNLFEYVDLLPSSARIFR